MQSNSTSSSSPTNHMERGKFDWESTDCVGLHNIIKQRISVNLYYEIDYNEILTLHYVRREGAFLPPSSRFVRNKSL